MAKHVLWSFNGWRSNNTARFIIRPPFEQVQEALEKLLVDVVADPLLLDSVSESEYPTIYEDAFSKYVVDESCLFQYAARRAVDKEGTD